MNTTTVRSRFDGLDLSVAYQEAESPKGILQIVHGMAEHKERYAAFMDYLSARGWITVIHDHRGHGASVEDPKDLGYLYKGGWEAMVDDVKTVQEWAAAKFPGLPVSLFGHSMGSMVVRSFTKRYDSAIDHLVVCGCPSDNPGKDAGAMLAKVIGFLCGQKYRSNMLDQLSFGSYNKPFRKEGRFAWLSANRDNVKAYREDPLCGYCFTCNGFAGLLGVMKDCYSAEGWAMANPDLPVMFISGAEDPCRVSDAAFMSAVSFMKERGYKNVSSKLYPGLRHEILLEKEAPSIYSDIFEFLSA